MYRASGAILVTAIAVALLGGGLQRANGSGSEPGLTLTHIAGALIVCALGLLAAGVVTERGATAVTADGGAGPADEQYVFITVSDGSIVYPLVGPYESVDQAVDELPRIQAQFDRERQYSWDVVRTADPEVVGVANDHVAV